MSKVNIEGLPKSLVDIVSEIEDSDVQQASAIANTFRLGKAYGIMEAMEILAEGSSDGKEGNSEDTTE